MNKIIVVRVTSLGPTISPETPLSAEVLDRVKLVARASRRLSRLWGSSTAKIQIEWPGGRAVLRASEEETIAIIASNREPTLETSTP
ncbi:MAG: hypothetical protein P3X22_003185 [Thermoprotei archaeon]|nr:hypothetical protein [Thermoprotei archaeon]